MPTIFFSGLSSGLDTATIIDSLKQVARRPIDALHTRRDQYTSQLGAFSDLESKLAALRTAARSIDTEREFKAYSASSSDSDISAVASSAATPGSYDITVNALALAERSYSDTFGSADQTGEGFGSGTLDITVGSAATVQISIDDSTDSLQDVADKINASVGGATATVIQEDTDVYRLLVQADETGTDNGLVISETGPTLDIGETANGGKQTDPQDASISIDSITFVRSTNTINDVIPGVTLTLNADPGATVTVAVSLDTAAVESKVQSFVDAYNGVATLLDQHFSFDGVGRASALIGDGALRTIQSRLGTVLSGQRAQAGEFLALSRVGVATSTDDGTLSLDSATFQAALASDADGVATLFSQSQRGSATASTGQSTTLAANETLTFDDSGIFEGLSAGQRSITLSSGSSQSTVVSAINSDTDIGSRILATVDAAGRLVLSSREASGAFSVSSDTAASSDSTGVGTSALASTDVEGIAAALVTALDDILEHPSGVLAARQEGIGDSIENIDQQISRLETGLGSYEDALRRQFGVMEQLIAALQTQGSFLSTQR